MKSEHIEAEQVDIVTKDGHVWKGLLLPSSDENVLTIKLKSGYNIGLDKKDLKSIKKLGKISIPREQKKLRKDNSALPNITILHTGGTVASEVDYVTGAVTPRFTPEELVAKVPELVDIANIDAHLVSNMWSEDMRFAHYNVLAQEVEKEIKKGVQGIIITHGTDTLHYTAAALSFMVQHCPIPVVLVGAQRSSDRPSSDAALNVLAAAYFIAQTDAAGVMVCMHKDADDDKCVILPGVNVRKNHTSRRNAFEVMNGLPIAEVSVVKKSVQFLRHDHKKRHANQPKIQLLNEKLKIGMLYAHPQMIRDDLTHFSSYDGLIVLALGLGQLPINNNDKLTAENGFIYKELAKLAKKIPVVFTAEALRGRINLQVYSTGRRLLDLGIIGNYCDMLPETAFVKLAYLLSMKKSGNELKQLMESNLVGEISSRSVL
ncbi:MAG: Glu-tRNA(Gln) amidotransferase subunit GatD [Nanoarchaeota archaeon]|nr:Glu-tRNA(Gln) amidotransferase subunit GatD [Nanoarchaeota archaeon]